MSVPLIVRPLAEQDIRENRASHETILRLFPERLLDEMNLD